MTEREHEAIDRSHSAAPLPRVWAIVADTGVALSGPRTTSKVVARL